MGWMVSWSEIPSLERSSRLDDLVKAFEGGPNNKAAVDALLASPKNCFLTMVALRLLASETRMELISAAPGSSKWNERNGNGQITESLPGPN
jgi:hypothetical protein